METHKTTTDIFADPVAYLACFGIQAELVATIEVDRAA